MFIQLLHYSCTLCSNHTAKDDTGKGHNASTHAHWGVWTWEKHYACIREHTCLPIGSSSPKVRHTSASDYQGEKTGDFFFYIFHLSILTSYPVLAKVTGMANEKVSKTHCNRDTGTGSYLQWWTRVTWFCVRGGGHIHRWQSLYQWAL